MKEKKLITVAIDSPAAAGAGTQVKLIAKHYNLFKLETGMIYRLIGYMRLKNPKKFNYTSVKKKMKNLKIYDLENKNLLSDKIAISASIVAKDKNISDVYFDRGGYKYHGRVKAFAETLRKNGLKF